MAENASKNHVWTIFWDGYGSPSDMYLIQTIHPSHTPPSARYVVE